jgi:hypothetical protein
LPYSDIMRFLFLFQPTFVMFESQAGVS